jgi:hypothetical protein
VLVLFPCPQETQHGAVFRCLGVAIQSVHCHVVQVDRLVFVQTDRLVVVLSSVLGEKVFRVLPQL